MHEVDELNIEELIEGQLCELSSVLHRTMSQSLQARLPVEDVVQETYVKALKAARGIEILREGCVGRWLLTIARNHIRSSIRKRAPQFGEIAKELVESGVLRPSEIVSKNEQIKQLESAIKKLPVRYQIILRSRYVDELSFEDLALCRTESAGALRGLHRNAISALRKVIKTSSRGN